MFIVTLLIKFNQFQKSATQTVVFRSYGAYGDTEKTC